MVGTGNWVQKWFLLVEVEKHYNCLRLVLASSRHDFAERHDVALSVNTANSKFERVLAASLRWMQHN